MSYRTKILEWCFAILTPFVAMFGGWAIIFCLFETSLSIVEILTLAFAFAALFGIFTHELGNEVLKRFRIKENIQEIDKILQRPLYHEHQRVQ